MRKAHVGIASIFSLGIMQWACGGTSQARINPDAAPGVPVVPVVRAVRASLSQSMVLTAEFIPYQEVDVMAKVAGYVKSIPVDIGDKVRQGELLATLEVPEMQDDLARAKAALQVSEAGIVTARDEVQRARSAGDIAHLSYTRLLNVAQKEPGLVPQQDVDEAHSHDLQAEAQLSAAGSSLIAAEQRADLARAEQARLQTMFQYTKIVAPFSGVVTKRYANVGSMIQAGTSSETQSMPLVRLSENSLLRLILPVPESAVPDIRVGEAVEVRVPSLNRKFPGRVTRFADKVQMSTRTMDTEVDVPNPGLVLVPGMYAEVDLSLVRHENALTVPLDAVDTSSSGTPHVWLLNGADEIHTQPVVTGIEDSARFEIRSGLRDGDRVVVGRHTSLRDGEKVHPRDAAFEGS